MSQREMGLLRERVVQSDYQRKETWGDGFYAHMRESEQRHLAATLALSLSTVICDEVWAIASWGMTRTAADVTRWEVVGRQPLQPTP
jgi:hypothetical protein